MKNYSTIGLSLEGYERNIHNWNKYAVKNNKLDVNHLSSFSSNITNSHFYLLLLHSRSFASHIVDGEKQSYKIYLPDARRMGKAVGCDAHLAT